MSLIKLSNIDFFYRNEPSGADFSLNNINLSVSKGEFISILGPNGSGKSTLLKIICALLSPQNGEVLLNGTSYKDIPRKNLAKEIAFVPQSTSVIYPFSVYEIVMMGRTPYLNFMGYEDKHDVEIVKDALHLVGIYNLRNKGINELSGGEAQRAFIARALVQQPKVMLLDEPNAHLDIEHQLAIFNLLKNLNTEQDVTIIMVSHDFNIVGFFSSRLIMMKEGKIVLDDSKENVLTKNNIKEIFNVNTEVNINNSGNISVIVKP